MSSASPSANDDRASFTIDPAAAEPVVAIVTAVARLKGVDSLDLSPLHEVIDSDAITTLYNHGRDHNLNWNIEFDYEDTRVTVTASGDGSVRLLTP